MALVLVDCAKEGLRGRGILQVSPHEAESQAKLVHVNGPLVAEIALEVLLEVARPDHGLIDAVAVDSKCWGGEFLVASNDEFGDAQVRWFRVHLLREPVSGVGFKVSPLDLHVRNLARVKSRHLRQRARRMVAIGGTSCQHQLAGAWIAVHDEHQSAFHLRTETEGSPTLVGGIISVHFHADV
jgi:hypothetical protein